MINFMPCTLPDIKIHILLCSVLITSCTNFNTLDESDLNYCVVNSELLVGAENGAPIDEKLIVKHCNIRSSDGSEKAIIVQANGKKYVYRDEVYVGAKVYFEYMFRISSDLLLVAYGYDGLIERENVFDYALYEVGKRGLIGKGQYTGRPRISDLID